jgi:hypothetical protein
LQQEVTGSIPVGSMLAASTIGSVIATDSASASRSYTTVALEEERLVQPIGVMGVTATNVLFTSNNQAKPLTEGEEEEINIETCLGPDLAYNLTGEKGFKGTEVEFNANSTVEFKINNKGVRLENQAIKPNENNFTFVAPAKEACALPQTLAAGKGCRFAIKSGGRKEEATYVLTYAGGLQNRNLGLLE